MAVYVQNNRALVTAYLAFIDDVTYATAAADPDLKTAALLALNDGYRRYLGGEYVDVRGDTVTYVWPFLKKTAQITLVTDDADYDLPDDYEGDIDGYVFDYNALTVDQDIEIVDHKTLLRKRRDDDEGGLPTHCTVRAKAFAAATGSVFEWLPFPTPTSTENGLTITYRYRFAHADLTDSATAYPIGLVGCGDLIVQAARANNEHDTAGKDGSETARFYRMMHEMVQRCEKVMPGRPLQHRIAL